MKKILAMLICTILCISVSIVFISNSIDIITKLAIDKKNSEYKDKTLMLTSKIEKFDKYDANSSNKKIGIKAEKYSTTTFANTNDNTETVEKQGNTYTAYSILESKGSIEFTNKNPRLPSNVRALYAIDAVEKCVDAVKKGETTLDDILKSGRDVINKTSGTNITPPAELEEYQCAIAHTIGRTRMEAIINKVDTEGKDQTKQYITNVRDGIIRLNTARIEIVNKIEDKNDDTYKKYFTDDDDEYKTFKASYNAYRYVFFDAKTPERTKYCKR